MAKSVSFGVLHIATAFGISWALTGDIAIAGAITLVEPLANTVVHYFHDRHWPKAQALWTRLRQQADAPSTGHAAVGLQPLAQLVPPVV